MITRRIPLALLLLVFLGVGASAQTYKDTRRGFSVKPPKGFEGVAVSPDEDKVVVRFAAENADSGTDSRGRGRRGWASFSVSIHPYEDEDGKALNPEAAEKIVWQSQALLGGATNKSKKIKVSRQPCEERTFDNPFTGWTVYSAVLPQEDGLFVFEGTAFTERFDKYARDFTKATKSFKRIDKADAADLEAELAQLDEQERFLQEQILRLPEGWSSLRTERYLFLYNADEDFVEELAEQIEAIRNVYETIWVPTEPIEAISIVRVCGSREDYYNYGGRPGTGGYWYNVARELVIFDSPPRDFARAVLNHEAFHQYIYYFYGELSPASWYNEGTGDYFAGAEMSRNYKIRGFGDAQGGIGRKASAKAAARLALNGKTSDPAAATHLKDLLGYTKAQYYRNGGKHYAQGWALVHMLMESRRLEPAWERIYPDYLDNLVEARHQVALDLKKAALKEALKEMEKRAEAKQEAGPDAAADDEEPEDLVAEVPTEIDFWYEQASKRETDKIQRIAYEKTFASWSDADWEEFNEAYLEYTVKL